MEIYLKFAENEAIMAKRQGQQEESPCEREPNQKAARLRRVSLSRSRAAVFGLYGLSFGSCPSEGSRFLEVVLTYAAQGALKILRHLAPRRTRGDAAFGIPRALVVLPAANGANVFHDASP